MNTPSTLRLARFRRALCVLLACSLPLSHASADERMQLRVLAEDFYKSYCASQDTEKFIVKSTHVSPGLKKAFASFMKNGPDHDPIIQGQDFPSSYKAEAVELIGQQKAYITLVPSDKGFSKLKLELIRNDKQWLLNGVNDFKAK